MEVVYRDRRLLPKRALVSTIGKKGQPARVSARQLARTGRLEAILMLADAAQFRGNFRLARELIQKVLENNLQDAALDLRPFAYHLLGIVRGAQDFHELALCYYQHAFRTLSPDRGPSFLTELRKAIIRRDISIALGKIGFSSDALREIRTCIREIAAIREVKPGEKSLQAESAISAFRLGHLHSTLGEQCANSPNSAERDAAIGEYLEANEEFRKALELLPKSGTYTHREANFLAHLADSELRLGRTESFLRYLDKAEKLATSHKLINRLAEIRFLRFEYALIHGDQNSAQRHLRASLGHTRSYDPAKALESVNLPARVYGVQTQGQRDLASRVVDKVASGYEAHRSGLWQTIAGYLRKVIAGQWFHRIRYVEALEGLLP